MTESDSDLSVTGWHLMFLRSARNAGFDVPDRAIADAVAYIRRTFSESMARLITPSIAATSAAAA